MDRVFWIIFLTCSAFINVFLCMPPRIRRLLVWFAYFSVPFSAGFLLHAAIYPRPKFTEELALLGSFVLQEVVVLHILIVAQTWLFHRWIPKWFFYGTLVAFLVGFHMLPPVVLLLTLWTLGKLYY